LPMGVSRPYKACAAMYLATFIGIAFGEVVNRSSRGMGDLLLLGAIASILCLVRVGFRSVGTLPPFHPAIVTVQIAIAQATFASLLLVGEVYSAVSHISMIPQLLALLPFLWGLRYFIQREDWLPAVGIVDPEIWTIS